MTDEKVSEPYPSPREFAQLTGRVIALETQTKQPQMTAQMPAHHELQGLSLAIQRMMDAMDRRASDGGGGSGVNVIVRALAIIGAISLGALGMYFFLHH